MSPFKNVALVGAAGNLGAPVLAALLDAGFNVTVLQRPTSTSAYPPQVHVAKTDFESAASLAQALQGQDAVVSTIATAALGQQPALIDAAVKAGVKRFIPSEFGVNVPRLADGSGLKKILAQKASVEEKLEKAAHENPSFSWTGISTSLFFDWGLKVGSLGFSAANKTATIYDSGNEPFTGTNLSTIGLAVASILKNPDPTANQYIDIASFVTTQNEILKAFEEETGAKWTVERKSTADYQKIGEEKLAKGDYSSFGDFLKAAVFADGKGQSAKPDQLWNEKLGLPKESLQTTIKKAVGS